MYKYLLIPLLTLCCFSCSEVQKISKKLIHKSPYERYESALLKSGLTDTKLVQQWKVAGQKALRDSVFISPPQREALYFQATTPQAIGYRLSLKKGELATFRLTTEPKDVNIFFDLFIIDTANTSPILHTSADTINNVIQVEIEETATYLIRIQPELLVNAKTDFSIITSPALSFPVEGKSNRDIWSKWGDPRDGGRRTHKGIDIFAAKGTPVIAIMDGVVSSVRNKGLGGKQVWLQGLKRQQSLYYAHLDSQMVSKGEIVKTGDTLGTVGNTGNAKNTRPHLHFGIYTWEEGAIDPEPFVALQKDKLSKIIANTEWIGQYARTKERKNNIRSAPHTKADLIKQIPRHHALKIISATGNWFRVQLPNQTMGYLYRTGVENLEKPLRNITIKRDLELRIHPFLNAPPIQKVIAKSTIQELAKVDGFSLVRGDNNLVGWLKYS